MFRYRRCKSGFSIQNLECFESFTARVDVRKQSMELNPDHRCFIQELFTHFRILAHTQNNLFRGEEGRINKMNTRITKMFPGVCVFLLLIVALSGCVVIGNGSGPPPPAPIRYGSVTICSGSPGVYGDVYINGRLEGSVLPNACISIHNLELDRNYTVSIETGWPGEVFTKSYFFSFDGQIVTVRE